MAFHTFDVDKADRLEDPDRYRFCSREELVSALGLSRESAREVVADLGSGTGFYTDDVAPYVETIYGVDVQSEMHDLYREKGVPDNVTLVTSTIEDLPFDDDALDAAFSTMTFHEFATPAALSELVRVLAPAGRLVTVDWAADGDGVDGPTTDERFTADEAATLLRDAGFDVTVESLRPETFLVIAEAPTKPDS